MTQPLSPAAQAVMDAANGACSYGPDDVLNDSRQIAAAALRAVASSRLVQVIQDEIDCDIAYILADDILAIAAELEGQPLPQLPTQPTTDPC